MDDKKQEHVTFILDPENKLRNLFISVVNQARGKGNFQM